MEPEIARRCGVCGASVRGAARFCPQCGQTMAGAQDIATQVRASAQPALVEEAERAASSISGRLAAREGDEREDAEGQSSRDAHVATAAQSSSVDDATVVDQPPTIHTSTSQASTATSMSAATQSSTVQLSEDTANDSQKVQLSNDGATNSARASAGGESLRPRVKKLRERSVVVLDEAADDPGLRFVLVAVALFVVALLLYVFSFVLR
ncbi:MAG: hypothetical protein QOE33_1252 [Acidobacteriota bacterium]|nr:hypothetical protein [Acidobacteriota bacterium]